MQSSPSSAAARPLGPSLVWKLVTLSYSIISGNLGLISSAIGLILWVVGVVDSILSYSLQMARIGSRGVECDDKSAVWIVSVTATVAKAMEFVVAFERDYGVVTSLFIRFITQFVTV